MSEKKFNPTQKKILQSIEQGLLLADKFKSREPFDFPCPNDDCPLKNGRRYMAQAFKNNAGGYSIYCDVCGTEEKLDKQEFKSLKKIFDHENAVIKNQKTNKPKACVPGSPDYFEEEYLDDEG